MNNILFWFSENWFMLIAAAAIISVAAISVIGFLKTPRSKQIEQVREMLLTWVVEAEKEFGSKTGKLKLSFVYDRLNQVAPAVAAFISFETFSLLVDEALEKMRTMLETNKNLQEYIYGKDGE